MLWLIFDILMRHIESDFQQLCKNKKIHNIQKECLSNHIIKTTV